MFAVYSHSNESVRVKVSVVKNPYGWYGTSNNAS